MRCESGKPQQAWSARLRFGRKVSCRVGLIAMSLAVTACTDLADVGGEGPVRSILGSTVQLFTEREGGGRRAGSGVVLATGLVDKDSAWILTTAHLLEPVVDQVVYVVPPRGFDRIPVAVAAVDSYRDIALLEAPAFEGTAVDMGAGAQLTDEIWIVAYPWGRARTIVKGIVSQIADAGADSDEIATWGPVTLVDATVSYGMSGGGVYHSQTGELLGLVRGYRTAQLSIGSDSTSLQIPIAGETTVIPTHEVACFLSSLDSAESLLADQTARWPDRGCPSKKEVDAARAAPTSASGD